MALILAEIDSIKTEFKRTLKELVFSKKHSCKVN